MQSSLVLVRLAIITGPLLTLVWLIKVYRTLMVSK